MFLIPALLHALTPHGWTREEGLCTQRQWEGSGKPAEAAARGEWQGGEGGPWSPSSETAGRGRQGG